MHVAGVGPADFANIGSCACKSSQLTLSPLFSHQGSLAEEWARAQEEERRYMDTRQERWRESLARAAAAADAGDEADDTDVEELMVRV